MKKPSVTRGPADRYAGPSERIMEILFPSGNGCLLSLRTLADGTDMIEVYCADESIRVRCAPERAAKWPLSFEP